MKIKLAKTKDLCYTAVTILKDGENKKPSRATVRGGDGVQSDD